MRKGWAFYFAILFLILTFVLVAKNRLINKTLVVPQVIFQTQQPLGRVMEEALAGTKGTYAIYIKNLKTGESFAKLTNQIFEVGSLYKLWVMAATFEEVQNENLKEDQVLSEDIATLNKIFEIDEDYQELTSGRITTTVGDAINQMVTISHNYAALLLTEKIKLSTVTNFLNGNELTKSKVGTDGNAPVSTASDIALFLEKLYKGEIVSPEYSKEMLEIMKKQELNGGLPKYLPEGVSVAHKTGDIGFFKHDAGIVFTDKGDWLIVILSESPSPAGAQERIAQVSKAVYKYFTKE